MILYVSKYVILRLYSALSWRVKRVLPPAKIRGYGRFLVRSNRVLYRAIYRFWRRLKKSLRPVLDVKKFIRFISGYFVDNFYNPYRGYRVLRQRSKDVLPLSLQGKVKEIESKASAVVNWSYAAIQKTYDSRGVHAAVEHVEQSNRKSLKANAYRILARRELDRDMLSAAQLAELSLKNDDSEFNRLRNCMTLWDAGFITRAHEVLQTLNIDIFTSGETEKALQIQGAYRLQEQMPPIPDKAETIAYEPDSKCVLYVASSSKPYHLTGYTTRTHHLITALRSKGWAVHCVTRPGYPSDRPDARNLDMPLVNIIDGVPYERVGGRHRREVRYDKYIIESVEKLEQAAHRLRPRLIHAASNYEAALPALIAARRLGIPFCYEVRGLWEYTAASKKSGWENTERFRLDASLEAHTARNADRVYTLTKALAAELVHRGVPDTIIELLPNAVNLSFFKRAERDQQLASKLGVRDGTVVFGYIGSVVKYEGLDDLIAAMPKLLERVPDSKLIIVGDGDELDNLKSLADKLGVAQHVIFSGKVPHEDVIRYFSLLTVITLPRKPYKVCNLVSPLKPFEAMAMKVPLIVSDVDALGEIFVHKETALLHTAGDSHSLACAMIGLAENPELRNYLAHNSYRQVSRLSRWEQVIAPLSRYYSECGG